MREGYQGTVRQLLSEVRNMIWSGSFTRKSAQESSLQKIVSKALELRDGRAIEDLLIEIGGKRASVEERSQAIVDIVKKNGDLNCVAIAGLHKLLVIDRASAGAVARMLLKEECCDDREIVRAAALRALIESALFSKQDLSTIAHHLHHRFATVRSAGQRAMRDLEESDRAKLSKALDADRGNGLAELKLFVKALPPARRDYDPELDMPLVTPRAKKSRPRPTIVTLPLEEVPRGDLPKDSAKSRPTAPAARNKVVKVAVKPTPHRDAATKPVNKSNAGLNQERPVTERPQEEPKPPKQALLKSRPPSQFEEFRREEFKDLQQHELYEAIRTYRNADLITGALAELATRFGIEAAQGVSDKLIWAISDPINRENPTLGRFAKVLFEKNK
jgi:hypothetical protein